MGDFEGEGDGLGNTATAVTDGNSPPGRGVMVGQYEPVTTNSVARFSSRRTSSMTATAKGG